MMSPVVEQIAEEMGPNAKVCKVNIDEQPELARKYNVMSIPTFLLFKDGKEVNEEVKDGDVKETGSYQIILTSDEYANEPTFMVHYWGHKVRMEARIDPADSVIKDFVYQLNKREGKIQSVTFSKTF